MRTRHTIALAGLSIAASGLLAACSGGGHDVATATISGRLVAVGGPAPGAARPLPGTVTLQNTVTHRKTVVQVNADGRYRATVAAGTYAIERSQPLVRQRKIQL